MREPSYFTREEYALTKVALAREEVPAEAFALLSAWIEGERLLVDDREDVGGTLLTLSLSRCSRRESRR